MSRNQMIIAVLVIMAIAVANKQPAMGGYFVGQTLADHTP
jgi:hypothetical protein